MISKHILRITFLNEPEIILFFLHIEKLFPLFLSYKDNYIYYQSFVYKQYKVMEPSDRPRQRSPT